MDKGGEKQRLQTKTPDFIYEAERKCSFNSAKGFNKIEGEKNPYTTTI